MSSEANGGLRPENGGAIRPMTGQGIDELAGYAGQVAVFWGDDG